MIKRFFTATLVGVILLSACGAATGVEIRGSWARPTMLGDNGAVYFLLQNHSAFSDELTGISSEFARAVELHENRMDGDVMQMRRILSLPIKGKQSILFGPGGYHVMLVGLKQELKPGDTIQVTLHFKNQEEILLTVPVQEMAPEEAMEKH